MNQQIVICSRTVEYEELLASGRVLERIAITRPLLQVIERRHVTLGMVTQVPEWNQG